MQVSLQCIVFVFLYDFRIKKSDLNSKTIGGGVMGVQIAQYRT